MDVNGDIPSCEGLMILWVLADKLLVPSLQNTAIDLLNQRRLNDRMSGKLESLFFNWVYTNTSERSMLRSYIVDTCSFGPLGDLVNVDCYPKELLVGIITVMRREKSSETWKPKEAAMTWYHVPEDIKENKARQQFVAMKG